MIMSPKTLGSEERETTVFKSSQDGGFQEVNRLRSLEMAFVLVTEPLAIIVKSEAVYQDLNRFLVKCI
jgi:hypothetical protein